MLIAAETFPHAHGKGLEGFPDPVAEAVGGGGGVGDITTPQRFTISPTVGSTNFGSHTLSPSVNAGIRLFDYGSTLLSVRGTDVQASSSVFDLLFADHNMTSTQVLWSRFNVSPPDIDLYYTVMEFTEANVRCQFIIGTILNSVTTATGAILSVDTARTVIIPSGYPVISRIGEGLPSKPALSDAQIWSVWWVLATSTTVTMNRNTVGSPNAYQLQVAATLVEFL